MPNAEIAEKTERLVGTMSAESLGGVLLGAQHNFSWLTAGAANGIDQSRDAGAGALLVRADGRRFVLASRIEMPRLLAEEISAEDFEPVEFPWEEEKASPTYLGDRARRLMGETSALGSDLPAGPNARVVEGAISRCRYRLTAPELERYRQLGRDAGEAVGRLVRSLSPGETETEVARRVSDALAARGIRAVVNLVAADERIEKFRHPVPTNRRWERVLMVVVCARRAGLIASLTRIVCAGTVPDELRRRTDACARVNARLWAATRPGATGAAGYRTRDWVAHPASAEVVHAGQAFAWNPSITGSKVEETVVAYEDGVEVISASPGWPQIVTALDGREYQSPDVLKL